MLKNIMIGGVFVFLPCIFGLAVTDNAGGPLVQTHSGLVLGRQIKSYDGRTVLAFEGIPYAKPPVGSLRFKAPQPADPWPSVLVANTTYTCVQFMPLIRTHAIIGTEDCLYLYIYVPGENITQRENLDVVVGIHGGAFMLGDPHMLCGPGYIMDRDLIYVSLNYRLGILGFLSTEDEASPGNYGLKDQVLVLRWVKDNIKHFGGNPDSVTLIGLSAGGASVHYHYLSPMSKGLFHRGFSQSGTALNLWALTKKPAEKARKLSGYFNCTQATSEELVNCLRNVKPEMLLRAAKNFHAMMNSIPYTPFGPVIEKGPDPFLPDHPYKILFDGTINDVTWIASNTINEGIFPVGFFVMYKYLGMVDEQWDDLIPALMDYNDTVEEDNKMALPQKIREFYFHNDTLTMDNLDLLINLFTDRLFLIDAETAVRLQARTSKSPVYYYLMDYKLVMKGLFPTTVTGVAHADDGRLLHPIIGNPSHLASTDETMKNIFLDFLLNFASGRHPSFGNTEWVPVQLSTHLDEINYMRISGPDNLKMLSIKQLAPREFWSSLPIRENQYLYKKVD